MPSTSQQRITLRNLKVAEFASEETLCFSATVLFDGKPIAHASNDGHGGSTFLRPLQDPDSRDRLHEAEAFAKSLPPDVTDYPDPNDSARKMTIEVTLDYLVDCLAEQQHTDKKVRSLFNRDMNNKVLFLKGARLLFLKGIKPRQAGVLREAARQARRRHRDSGRAAARRSLRAMETTHCRWRCFVSRRTHSDPIHNLPRTRGAFFCPVRSRPCRRAAPDIGECGSFGLLRDRPAWLPEAKPMCC